MSWDIFPIIAWLSVVFWAAGIVIFLIKSNNVGFKKLAQLFSFAGALVLLIFLGTLWIQMGRPPMRTIGETRLWYSVFLPLVGLFTFRRWQYSWLAAFSNMMAMVFLILNITKPENFEKALMPALQSPWFVPHVILFIFSYAVLAGSAFVAFRYLVFVNKNDRNRDAFIWVADNLVNVGISLFTIAMLFGALWAKEAWGHYWSWDPKETWAFLTWMVYLIYILYRLESPLKSQSAMVILVVAFIALIFCWFGVNMLPSAQASVHVYN